MFPDLNATVMAIIRGSDLIVPRSGEDVLKVNDEYMKIEQVGFSSLPTGTINDATDDGLQINALVGT